jgi:hypothetical protein
MKRLLKIGSIILLILIFESQSFAAVILLNKAGNSPSNWSGLSTDAKPTTGNIGSTFYEENTTTPYIYGFSGWVQDKRRGGSGGGGTWGSITGTITGQSQFTGLNVTGLAKFTTGTNLFSVATAGTDYQPVPVQIPYTSATPWTPAPAVGTAGAEIRWYCNSVDHALTFGAPTETPVNGQVIIFELMSDGSAHALDFTNAAYVPDGVTLPTTTVGSKLTSVVCRWHSGRGKWMVKSSIQEP